MRRTLAKYSQPSSTDAVTWTEPWANWRSWRIATIFTRTVHSYSQWRSYVRAIKRGPTTFSKKREKIPPISRERGFGKVVPTYRLLTTSFCLNGLSGQSYKQRLTVLSSMRFEL